MPSALLTRAELFDYITPNDNPRIDLFHLDGKADLSKDAEHAVSIAWDALEAADENERSHATILKESEEETADAEKERDVLKARVEALELSLTDLASYAAYAAEEMGKDTPDGDLKTIGEQLASQAETSREVCNETPDATAERLQQEAAKKKQAMEEADKARAEAYKARMAAKKKPRKK